MLPLVEMSKGHGDSKNSNDSLLCYVCDSLKDPDCGSEDPEVIWKKDFVFIEKDVYIYTRVATKKTNSQR